MREMWAVMLNGIPRHCCTTREQAVLKLRSMIANPSPQQTYERISLSGGMFGPVTATVERITVTQ